VAKQLYTFAGKGLSIKEPWASAIAFAGKDIENRSWQCHYRGPLGIHASNSFDPECLEEKLRQVRGGKKNTLAQWIAKGQRSRGYDPGDELVKPSHIVAIGMLVDCVQRSASPWFGSKWGWVIEGVIPIVPIPWTGGLSTWDCKFKYTPL
jgi:hypothetical protein